MINPIRDKKMRRILRLGAEKTVSPAMGLTRHHTISFRFSEGPRRTTDRFDRRTHMRFFGFRIVRNVS